MPLSPKVVTLAQASPWTHEKGAGADDVTFTYLVG